MIESGLLDGLPTVFATPDVPDACPVGPPMRVCIDARMLGSDGTGVARYSRTLIDALASAGVQPLLLHADVDGAGRLRRWIGSTRRAGRFAREQADCVVSSADRSLVARDVFREAQVHFNLYGRLLPIRCEGPPGVMHWTYPVPLTMLGWRNVYTVHDVIPLSDSGLSPIRSDRHRKMLRTIARSADRLITVSRSARTEIIRALGCDPAFVTNTSQAVSVSSDDVADADVGDTDDYFLFCGTIEPRKNLARLAEAYRRSGVQRKLVIIGPDGWRADGVRQLLEHANVLVLPFQPRDRLIHVMKHARALLFPSLSEGFGLPVAEAMALGTPVMTSALGATAEVAGDAAALVDPFDVDAMAAVIQRLDIDSEYRDRLRVAGLERAMSFRPLPYAHRLLSIYAELLAADASAPRKTALKIQNRR